MAYAVLESSSCLGDGCQGDRWLGRSLGSRIQRCRLPFPKFPSLIRRVQSEKENGGSVGGFVRLSQLPELSIGEDKHRERESSLALLSEREEAD